VARAELKPYGKDAAFTKECVGCHIALSKNRLCIYRTDWRPTVRPQVAKIFLHGFAFLTVFALGVFGCAGEKPKVSASLNQTASLMGELPANPLAWRVITSSASRNDSTMSTLYGNDVAVQYARANSDHKYPNGSALSLVTWTQQEDSRWFGAKIPAPVKSWNSCSLAPRRWPSVILIPEV